MAYKIDKAKCLGCGACTGVCPVMAIIAEDGKFTIDKSKCVDCGSCVGACPMMAIAKDA